MSEHCRAPNSCRGCADARNFLLLQSLNSASSLSQEFGLWNGLPAYPCSSANQAQTPRLNRVRATAANGSAGNQTGTWCISKALRGLGAVSARARCPETDDNRCNRCRATAPATRAESNKRRPRASKPRAPNRISRNRAPSCRPGGLA